MLVIKVVIVMEEYEEYKPNNKRLELNESQTYYGLKLMTNDWIIKTLYISKPQISFKKSMTIMQLKLQQDIKEEILGKAKFEYLKTKMYLMIITLYLNLLENDTKEAY